MKYQSNLISIITVRVEMKLTKNGVVCTQKRGTGNFAAGGNFATVAKIRYVVNFRYVAKFHYCSENSLCSEISYK